MSTQKYVPPHLRKAQEAAPASANTPPVQTSTRKYSDERSNAASSTSTHKKSGERTGGKFSSSRSRNMQPDPRLERELFGDPESADAGMTSGINFDKYEDIPVEITGKNIPEPANTFAELDLEPQLLKNIQLSRYTKPTPIQKHAIAVALAGRDLMACAQTGSGKTAAFLLPTISAILRSGNVSDGELRRSKVSPRALVLAPTRELATQIFEESRKFCYCTGLRSVVIYGGADIRNQLRELEGGCDILVATPGRLQDLLERGRVSLSLISHLVFDEADRMLDMGFEPQIRQIVEEEGMPVDGRKTFMFSATFPREIQRLASDFLGDYIFLTIGRVGSTNDFIIQKIEFAEEYDKKQRLMHLLVECEGLTVIFVETKRNADNLEHFLIDSGVNAISIHGDRTQPEREYALRQFKCGNCPVLVATDVAARGLDIPNVMHVINYDLPNNVDDYVHRIGRTGRCGNTGTAHSFINEKNRNISKELYDLLKECKQEIPSWFEDMVYQSTRKTFGSSRGGSGRSFGGSSRGGSSRYGAKDVRKVEEAPRGAAPRPGGNNINNNNTPKATSSSGSSWDMYNVSQSRDAW